MSGGANPAAMATSVGDDTMALELALLRRGLLERLAGCERCDDCRRTPLPGERVYVYESGAIACALCRAAHPQQPLGSRAVHGPEFGHTIRIVDQRAT